MCGFRAVDDECAVVVAAERHVSYAPYAPHLSVDAVYGSGAQRFWRRCDGEVEVVQSLIGAEVEAFAVYERCVACTDVVAESEQSVVGGGQHDV